jgi:hypothetical protein
MTTEPAPRPGLGWWLLMATCVLIPPVGLVCLGVMAWQKWKGKA